MAASATGVERPSRNVECAVSDGRFEIRSGLLLPDEARALHGLPGKANAALTWLATVWETALDPRSGKACSKAVARNADNGRYSSVFGQVRSRVDRGVVIRSEQAPDKRPSALTHP